jgi:hypothetical protein
LLPAGGQVVSSAALADALGVTPPARPDDQLAVLVAVGARPDRPSTTRYRCADSLTPLTVTEEIDRCAARGQDGAAAAARVASRYGDGLVPLPGEWAQLKRADLNVGTPAGAAPRC